MNFLMDERVKYRVIGIVVILSIVVIFLPAMLKKSNPRFEENVSISVRLPAKPEAPKVTIAQSKAMFDGVKVAQVNIPKENFQKPATQIAKAEPIRAKSLLPAAPAFDQKTTVAKKAAPLPRQATTVVDRYAVQVASFARQNNAETLVSRLRSKGYQARYNKSNGKREYYKVVVGQLDQKEDAKLLQKELLTNLRLNGLVVKAEVS